MEFSQREDPLSQQLREENIQALKSGSVNVRRKACLPFFRVPAKLTRAFKPPWKRSEGDPPLKKKTRFLGIRRSRLKQISTKNLAYVRPNKSSSDDSCDVSSDSFVQPSSASLLDIAANVGIQLQQQQQGNDVNIPEVDDLETKGPKVWEPLILWEGEDGPTVEVEPILCKWLRPHQREGVQFLVECVCGLRDYEGAGCILADDMGLGKTLQAITLTYTLLRQYPFGKDPLKRVVVVCPTSLIGNWADEFRKWLGKRVRVAACDKDGNHSLKTARQFLREDDIDVLVISYETFRMHVELFADEPDKVDLLICDEAHRLKNNETLTSQSLNVLSCRRRVLLSGTPMQNKLDEFYAMVDFTNPGILGKIEQFRRRFVRPIEYGREPGCTEKEEKLGTERAAELQKIVDEFIVRRTNDLLAKHLPDKVVQVVCVRMAPLQQRLYEHLLAAKLSHYHLTGKHTGTLQSVNALKKVCNHPNLVFADARRARDSRSTTSAHGLIESMHIFPEEFSSGRGGRSRKNTFDTTYSGKFSLMDALLRKLRKETDDRIVIVSNYTQTLDLFVQLCSKRRWPYIKLDGSTSVKKRTAMVHRFNDKNRDEFVFLLSSKAGGCGLNLIGGNRLVLFDPDWNPATDKQAAARVWRDGQKKRVFIYRLFATGTIEEKIFQRQISKEGLQNAVVENDYNPNLMSSDDLHDIFSIDTMSASNTHDSLKCTRCERSSGKCKSSPSIDLTNSTIDENTNLDITNERGSGEDMSIDVSTITADSSTSTPNSSSMLCDQEGDPSETEVMLWAHHNGVGSLKDKMLREIGGPTVSFVFELEVRSQKASHKKKKKKKKVDVVVEKKMSTSTSISKKRVRDDKDEKIEKDKENSTECCNTTALDDVASSQKQEHEVRCLLHNNAVCGLCSYELESK